MDSDEKTQLVNAWIELQQFEIDTPRYNELSWSIGQMWDLVREDPDTAFDVILTILRADSSSTVQENLSAGPLEDFLVYHGPAFIERIEREAAINPAFRHLLGGVWKNDMTDEVWSRVQTCWERRGWDGIPNENES